MIPIYIKMAVIALWCGNPGYIGLNKDDVNKCRKQVFECLQTNKTTLQAESCFMGTKLKE